MTSYEKFSLIINGVTLTGVIFGIYFGIRQIKLLITQVNNDYTWRQRQNALGYSLTRSEQHMVARLNLEKTFGRFSTLPDALSIKVIDEQVSKDSRVSTDIRVLLGHWENMALSIHAKVSDEEVCYEMVSGSVNKAVRVFHNYIERARDKNPDIYKYLINLSTYWREKKLEKPVKKFSDLTIS